MQIKTLITLITVIFLQVKVYSQQLKTFSGLLENGKTTYQYYEDADFNRVYHGKFNWLGGMSNKLQVSGQYVNDKKSGLWIEKELNSSGVAVKTMTFNFEDGILDGAFKYVNSSTKESSSAIFKDGHFIGDFFYSSTSISIKAKFDEYGYADGDWQINLIQDNVRYVDTRTYSKGFLRKRIYRNLNSGEVIVNIKGSGMYNGFENLSVQEITSYLFQNGYKVRRIPISSDYRGLNDAFQLENYDGGYQYPRIKDKLWYSLCDFFIRGSISKFKSVPQQYRNCYLNFPLLQ